MIPAFIALNVSVIVAIRQKKIIANIYGLYAIIFMQPLIQTVQDITLVESLRTTLNIGSKMQIIQRNFAFGIILSVLIGAMQLVLLEESQSWLSIMFSFLALPLFMLLFFGGLSTIIVQIIYKFNPYLFKGKTCKFTSWGMERISRSSNYTTPWWQFTGCTETKKFSYLFLDKECHPNRIRL